MAKGTIKSNKDVMNEAATEALKNTLTVVQDMTEVKETQTKKERNNETQAVNFNMSKSMYEELKKVFGGAGYSFAQGSRMTFDYILSEIADGNIEIRESGFRKTLSARVGR
ncbi:MAG: hypothetical protein IKJ59_13625 [Clostridia bacterium]|jgi:NADH:ubiquinone oxidoreductase subunit C|nr:hypothetical protein [uncultured Treponema sp.]MBQ5472692.1 hypothetical protein [Treponema sp.]MBR3919749.1 hypothetical protein [Clostridia bacterium]MCQ2088409.1 hypothetical protein [Bacilli bacterium]MBR6583674.1 hypothetical protein [Treponema sp.]MEE1212943.1 hypothetical protein [Treponema sp.]